VAKSFIWWCLLKIPVTAIIATRNEELNILQCIESAKCFSEILVVDSISSDMTVQLAKSVGVKVIDFTWNGQYPKKRQWILNNVEIQNDWIFFLDADERITPKLERELLDLFQTKTIHRFAAGQVKMEYFFAGQRLKHGYKIRSVKLLQKSSVFYPNVGDLELMGMGEIEGHFQPIVSGKIYKINSMLQERDLDPISSWAHRHVEYAKWDASVNLIPHVRRKVNSSKSLFGRIFHKLPFRPLIFFLYSYFLRFGFLDGKKGFDYAFGYTWFYWLAGVIHEEKIRNMQN
jgi:glycosyltransferase involved in cell wall biosynthesis